MVLPFALVILGCRYLFLFLSLYTASYSPSLQHVQAMVNASSDFALTNRIAPRVTMAPRPMMPCLTLRRQWDPGIPKHIDVELTMSPIDPGDGTDRPPAPLHASIWVQAKATLAVPTKPTTSLPIVGLCQADGDNDHVGLWLSYHALSHASVDWQSSNRSSPWCYPFLSLQQIPPPTTTPLISADRPASGGLKCREVLIQSLFQYSHPILSRPTVPNIQ